MPWRVVVDDVSVSVGGLFRCQLLWLPWTRGDDFVLDASVHVLCLGTCHMGLLEPCVVEPLYPLGVLIMRVVVSYLSVSCFCSWGCFD